MLACGSASHKSPLGRTANPGDDGRQRNHVAGLHLSEGQIQPLSAIMSDVNHIPSRKRLYSTLASQIGAGYQPGRRALPMLLPEGLSKLEHLRLALQTPHPYTLATPLHAGTGNHAPLQIRNVKPCVGQRQPQAFALGLTRTADSPTVACPIGMDKTVEICPSGHTANRNDALFCLQAGFISSHWLARWAAVCRLLPRQANVGPSM